jgi:dienelactone hydrolase
MKHLLSLPRSEGSHPLLCFLHGYDEAAPRPLEEALTRHGPLRPGNPARVKDDFILLAPQLPIAGDVWHRHADEVQALVATTLDRLGGDPKRAYLTGFSFGANGVFDLALLQPDLWSALWPVDPTRVPRSDPGRPVWLSAGEVTRYQKGKFIAALSLAAPQVALMRERVYDDEGDDHVGAARRAYADERIYSWLLHFTT